METQFGVLSKAIEVMGLQPAAALAALLAGVVIALIYRFAPSGCLPRFTLAFCGERCAVFPVGRLFGIFAHVSMAAWLAAIGVFAYAPSKRAFKFLVAVLADKNTNAAFPCMVACAPVGIEETFTGTVITTPLANFTRQSLERFAACLANAFDLVFFRLRVTGVGTILALCARGIFKQLAAVRADGLNGFHITLLAQGVGLFGAGQFVAKNEGSETLIRHYLAPQIHYTTGGA